MKRALLVAVVLLAQSSCFAAIGVYEWRFTAAGGQPPARVHYRLNCPGSVSIDILNASNQVVRSLGPYVEVAGEHDHYWDGSGAASEGGIYRARITATNGGAGSAGSLQPIFAFTPPAAIYGLAVDKHPSSPAYGTIYAGEPRIGGRIRAYYPDGSPKWGFGGNPNDNVLKLGFDNVTADTPWGIGVDSQGNIYAARKAAPRIEVGVKVFDCQGSQLYQLPVSEETANFWIEGLASSAGLEVYETVGSAVRVARAGEGIWQTVMGPPLSNERTRQLCFEPGGAACYVASYTHYADPQNPNKGVRRYVRPTGGEWTLDSSFAPGLQAFTSAYGTAADFAVGVSCDTRDPDGAGPYASSCLWIGLGCSNSQFGGNIVRRILPQGSPQLFVGPGLQARMLAADALGNVAIECGPQQPWEPWSYWGMYAPGGEGSSDVRLTGYIQLGSAGPQPVARIAEAKKLPDGSLVEFTQPKPVSAVFGDCFYVQEADRSCAVRVIGASPPTLGQSVRIRGTVWTTAGERRIKDAEIMPG